MAQVLGALYYVGILAARLVEQPQDVQTGEELGDDHDDHGEGDDQFSCPRTAGQLLGDLTDTAGDSLGVLSHYQEQLDQ